MCPDFNRLKALASSSPEEFEKERVAIINELIRQHHNASRAQGIQWRIDMEMTKAKTPLGVCVKLSSQMWDEFYKLKEALHQLVHEVTALKKLSSDSQPHSQLATVLPFKKPNRP